MDSDVRLDEIAVPDNCGDVTICVLSKRDATMKYENDENDHNCIRKDSDDQGQLGNLSGKDPDEDSGLSTQWPQQSVSSADRSVSSARSGDRSSPDSSEKPAPISSWLFRLFESEMFDAHLAVVYLFRNNDAGVRSYVTNKLFQLDEHSVFFYLPQLVTMYIRYDEALSEALHSYLAHRCAESAETAVCTAWLIDAFSTNALSERQQESGDSRPAGEKQRAEAKTKVSEKKDESVPSANRVRSQLLRNAIVSDQLRFLAAANHRVASIRVDSASASSTEDSNVTEAHMHGVAGTAAPSETVNRGFRKHKRTTSDMGVGALQQLTTGAQALQDRPMRKMRSSKTLGLGVSGRLSAARSPSIASLVSVASLQFDLSVGRAFETACVCSWRHSAGLGLGYACSSSNLAAASSECMCTCGSGGRRIQAELRFVHSLVQIGKRLKRLRTKDERTAQLRAELGQINQNLPARIWLPTLAAAQPHVVLRIPNQIAVVLNSKERAPFMIFVEIALCSGDPFDDPLPIKDTRLLNGVSERLGLAVSANCDDTVSFASSCASSSTQPQTQPQPPSLNGTITATQFSDVNAEPLNRSGGDERPTEATQYSGNGTGMMTLLRAKQADTVSISTFDSVCEDAAEEAEANESDSVSMSEDLRITSYNELQLRSMVHVSASAHAGLNKQALDMCSDRCSLRNNGERPMLGCDSERSSVAQLNYGESEMFVSAAAIRKRLTDSAEQESKTRFERDPDDPSASVLKEPFRDKCARIRAKSPFGYLPNWRLVSVIVKCGDDLRQELLAYQFMTCLAEIWSEQHIPLWLKPVRIVVVSPDCGFVEPIQNAVSIHQVKKAARTRLGGPQAQTSELGPSDAAAVANSGATGGPPPSGRLLDYFVEQFGGLTSERFLMAQRNFVESCAAYCIVSYLLQVKDRHNGNILVDDEGHLIHIDFGFILSTSPGRNFGFEMSAFKLTAEYLEVLGGLDSDMFAYLKLLILKGLLACRKHADRLSSLIEIMMECGVELPCFRKFDRTKPSSNVAAQLRSRFHLNLTEEHLHKLVEKLVAGSLNSYSTRLYDTYQYFTNGILC